MYENNTRYAGIAFDDVVNGEGLGAVFFTQYCPHRCKQCHNPSTWSKNGGEEFTVYVADSLMDYYEKAPFANRLTISGGEPLTEFSTGIVRYIVDRFKETYPDKKVWLYTGHTFEHILQMHCIYTGIVDVELNDILEIVKKCDVIVDGTYKHDLRDVSLPWQGSSNQRVIDVQKSLEAGSVVLYE